jgi:hypothetical protein
MGFFEAFLIDWVEVFQHSSIHRALKHMFELTGSVCRSVFSTGFHVTRAAHKGEIRREFSDFFEASGRYLTSLAWAGAASRKCDACGVQVEFRLGIIGDAGVASPIMSEGIRHMDRSRVLQ